MIAHFATDINVGRNRESPKNMYNLHFGLSENMHRAARLVIFGYSTAYFEWWWRYWGGNFVGGVCWCSTYFHFSQARLGRSWLGKSWLGIFESWVRGSLVLNLWLQHRKFSPVEPLEKSSLLCYNGCNKKPPRAGACGSCEVEVEV